MRGNWSELRETLRGARGAGRRIPVFFRDDDAIDDRPALRDLLALFCSRRVAINLEVIPGLLTSAGAKLLGETAAAHPELIGLNQHGWRHENHEATGRKSEFGQSRNFDQQHRDISAGRQAMAEAFGDHFFPVFTPPWNRCTAVTHDVLTSIGFAAISDLGPNIGPDLGSDIGHKKNGLVNGLVRLPATLDIIDWKSSRDLRPVEWLLDQLQQQIEAGKQIGIMLHHQVMSPTAFDFVAQLVDVMVESGAIDLHLFQTLLKRDHE